MPVCSLEDAGETPSDLRNPSSTGGGREMPGPLWILLLTPLAVQQKVNLDPLADAPALAARIDAFVEKHWRESKVKPALPVDDAAFLRRITLDLAGRIPSRDEAVAFAQDRRPDRRG